MKNIPYVFVIFLALAACSGPSYFKNPADFVGGNKAAAIETHCYKTGGMNKQGVAYKLCQQGFHTHYGK